MFAEHRVPRRVVADDGPKPGPRCSLPGFRGDLPDQWQGYLRPVFRGRRRPVLIGSFLLATPLLATFAMLSVLPVLVLALVGIGFAIQLSVGLSFAYVRQLVDSNVAATAVAVQTAVGFAGAFFAPIVGGSVIEQYSEGLAFTIAGALSAVGIVIAWVSPEPRHLGED
jgi:MFS family permease